MSLLTFSISIFFVSKSLGILDTEGKNNNNYFNPLAGRKAAGLGCYSHILSYLWLALILTGQRPVPA